MNPRRILTLLVSLMALMIVAAPSAVAHPGGDEPEWSGGPPGEHPGSEVEKPPPPPHPEPYSEPPGEPSWSEEAARGATAPPKWRVEGQPAPEEETCEPAGSGTPKPEQPKPEQPTPTTSEPEKPVDQRPLDEKPKHDTPEPEKPEKPTPEKPKPEKPTPEQPTPEKPKPDQPKPEQPTPEQPTPEKPKPDQPKPEKPKPEQPKPEQPKTDVPAPPAPPPATTPQPVAAPPPPPAPATTSTSAPTPRTRIVISKAGPRRAFAGGRVRYVIRIRNVGRNVARNIRIRDLIPSGYSLAALRRIDRRETLRARRRAARTGRATLRRNLSRGRLTWSLAALRPGEARVIRLVLRADAGLPPGGRCNVVDASGSNVPTRRTRACAPVVPRPAPRRPAVTG